MQNSLSMPITLNEVWCQTMHWKLQTTDHKHEEEDDRPDAAPRHLEHHLWVGDEHQAGPAVHQSEVSIALTNHSSPVDHTLHGHGLVVRHVAKD